MQFKSLIRYIGLSILVLAVILQALFLALPTIVETLIQKHLSRELPGGMIIFDPEFTLEKIGIGHTLVSHIKIGQGLFVELMDLQYHLEDLKTFKLEKITITGLTIHARLDSDNQLHFNGLTFPDKIKDDPGDSNPFDVDFFTKFLPKQVVIKDASLSIKTPEQDFLLPFEVLAFLDGRKNKVVVNTSFYPFGQTVKAVISCDFNSGIEFAKVEAKSFHPEVLSLFLPKTADIKFSGPVNIDILKTFDSDLQLSLSQLKLDLFNLSKVKIENFMARVGIKEGKIAAKGGFDLSGSPVPAMGVIFDFKFHEKTDLLPFFNLTLKNRKVNSITLDSQPYEIILNNPDFLFSLKGDWDHQDGQFLFDCKNFKANHDKRRLFVKNFMLKSKITGDFSDNGNGFNFDIQSKLSQVKFLSKSGQAEVMAVNMTGKMDVSKQFDSVIQMDTRIKNGKIKVPKLKMAASGINARLPLEFPFKKPTKKGSFFVQEIAYDNKLTASLKANITQDESFGVKIGGQMAIADLNGFNLKFEGKAGGGRFFHARIDYITELFLLKPAHLEKIMSGLSLSSDSMVPFSSKGTIEYKYPDIKARASVIIDGGHLFFPDIDIGFSGIAGTFNFNDLLVPESLPGQILTIDKIQARQLIFDKLKLQFSIEDGKSINFENLRFNWCNGIVSTESVRLSVTIKDHSLSLILYCDRLELSSLLKQMGAFHAEGEGALSGRIPIIYSNGNISFNNGFLFSTPGKGGRVVIENTQSLTAGIPMDTPQFVQLDLAREALKDFDYKWAKLELNTFEDTLYVNMELDGKPAKLLPFKYQKNKGSLIRVDAKSPGSIFQGIKMNVNIKLPFNQVLKFTDKINRKFN
ncbi:MAG: hypothetical protein GY710_04770 [Desulfobacteraceae bacterium]|nr:hypothetical protein [Desulfobacteraceae bacterium]